MNKITVEGPEEGEGYDLFGWYRITANGNETIAYVPDKVTADEIVRAIEAIGGHPFEPRWPEPPAGNCPGN